MFTNQDLLERIEDAERLAPFCDQCGSPTTVAERDGALWLECSSIAHRPRGLRALLKLDFASLHTRREITALQPAA
jgi:hypothetical protein